MGRDEPAARASTTTLLKVEWGKPVLADEVKKTLAAKKYQAVTVVHNETSIGTISDLRRDREGRPREQRRAPLRGRRDVARRDRASRPTSGASTSPSAGRRRPWRFRPASRSSRSRRRRSRPRGPKKFRGLYLDLLDVEAFGKKKQNPTTPSLPLLYAMDFQLDHILAEGLENRWARHHDMLAAVEEWAPKAGFRFLPEAGAPTRRASRRSSRPRGLPEELNKAMKKAGFTPGSGYGKFKTTNIRIGHMGDVDVALGEEPPRRLRGGSAAKILAAAPAAGQGVSAAAPGPPEFLVAEPLSETGLAVLSRAGLVADVRPELSREALLSAIGGYDALVVRSATKVDRELLTAGKKLRVVARAGVGLDNVDVKAATERGILVVNAPSGNVVSAAEHADRAPPRAAQEASPTRRSR